jgi:uncharacterized membrane protein YgdD (TMEM256/DUF423 family)
VSGLVRLAALSMAAAVAMGAFAAHGASPKTAELLRTGALYQMIHGVAVIALAKLGRARLAALLLLGGSLLFSLSIYALAFGGPRWIGPVTPIGGAAMIAGWLLLALKG